MSEFPTTARVVIIGGGCGWRILPVSFGQNGLERLCPS
jgi:hypothetical protein